MSSDVGISRSLWDRLTDGAHSFPSALHCWVGHRYESASWDQVVRDAEAMTAGLRNAGVRPGTTVAAVLTNIPHVVRGLLGVWLAGGAVASLPGPSRGMHTEGYVRQIAEICKQLEPVIFLGEDRILGLIPEDVRQRLGARAWESFVDTGRVAAEPAGEDELVFIQYSSGSVSAPKGCMLSPRAIAAQLDIVTTMVEPSRHDKCVSWLPLSHDMGVFGSLLTCMTNRTETYLSTPERFIMSPSTWFSDMARFGATMTVGSNTALYLAARAAIRRSSGWPKNGLAQTRTCIIGAERVKSQTLRFAVDALGPHGFRPEALMPAYGLAEATLAVTATPLHEQPRQLAVNAIELADGALSEIEPDDPAAAMVVSAGPPCQGVTLPEVSTEQLVEIRVRSPSLAMGYWGDKQRTEAHFHDGTLLTGDWGFVRDGHLYPVGRTDDLISVAGRKVYAREIESAVEDITGVRCGCSALVGYHDDNAFRLTLFVEAQRGHNDFQALAEQAASISMAKAAVALDECVFLSRNSLPRTPSGKIQRNRCWQLFRAGSFEPLAIVRLGRK